MSFTNKDGSLKSKVYESLTRCARREKSGWEKEYVAALKANDAYSMGAAIKMAGYWGGYKEAVYDTLKKLTELEDAELEAWSGLYDALYEGEEILDDPWYVNGLR